MHSPPGMSTAGSDGALPPPPPPPSSEAALATKAFKRTSSGGMIAEAAEKAPPPRCAPAALPAPVGSCTGNSLAAGPSLQRRC